MLQLVTTTFTNFGCEALDQLRDLCPWLTVSQVTPRTTYMYLWQITTFLLKVWTQV